MIYVTSLGSQLAVKALELVLESFTQPCFACHVQYDLFWPVGRTARTSK